MERFMRAEEEQLQAAQAAADDLSPLIPVADIIADTTGSLLSSSHTSLVMALMLGTLRSGLTSVLVAQYHESCKEGT